MTVTDAGRDLNRRDGSMPVVPPSFSEGVMLADDDEDQEERGRIGYGPNERTSSWLLGLILMLVIAAIGISSLIGGDGEGDAGTGAEPTRNAGPAPDFAMTTFEGDTFQLSDHLGEVVIVNFWGSWCDPCREEMPAFQEASRTSGDDVTFVGVGSKRDREDKAREFADEFGVTYPIGLDSEGGSVAAGQITKDYNVSFYPTTFIIGPDGDISSVVVGQMDTDDLAGYIAKAREDAR